MSLVKVIFITFLYLLLLTSCTPRLHYFHKHPTAEKNREETVLGKIEGLNRSLRENYQLLTLVSSIKLITKYETETFELISFFSFPDRMSAEFNYFGKLVFHFMLKENNFQLFYPLEKKMFYGPSTSAFIKQQPLFKFSSEYLINLIGYKPVFSELKEAGLWKTSENTYFLEYLGKGEILIQVFFDKAFTRVQELAFFSERSEEFHVYYRFREENLKFPKEIEILDFRDNCKLFIYVEEIREFLPEAPDLFYLNPADSVDRIRVY